MSRLAAAALAVVGCSFQPGQPQATSDAAGAPTGDGGGSSAADAAVQTPADAADAAPTCTTSGLTCLGSATAMMCNGACWVKCQNSLAIPNQLSVALSCAGWGGQLAPIRDAGDQACVEQMLFPSQASWIGFQQAPSQSQVDSGWSHTLDGVSVASPGWGAGQPNDANGSENSQEDCAFMNTAGEWHDTSCGDGGLFRFSCRR